MKKVLSLGVAALLTATLGSTQAFAKESPKFTKITDYMYEVTYDKYEHNKQLADAFASQAAAMGGCSSLQYGYLRGRNYDWTYDECPSFVVRVPANKAGRHASVGLAVSSGFTPAEVDNGTMPEAFKKIIPFATIDGINDAGLSINLNVVNYGEMGKPVMKTEDKSDDIAPFMVPRAILDNCGSIDEAIEMISKMDLYPIGTVDEAHFMISGPQSKTDSTFNTVVVEFIPDKNGHYQLSIIDHNKGQFVDNKPIMTNFHLTGFNGSLESTTRHPMGWERYEILSRDYEQGKTVRGMADLMKKVYFTNAYDLHKDSFWYSELAVGDLDMTNRGAKNLKGDISAAGAYAASLQNTMNDYNAMKRDGKTWHTVATTIYDSENKVMYLQPQEGSLIFEFPLNKKK